MKTLFYALTVLFCLVLATSEAFAQSTYYSQARPGVFGRNTATTNNYRRTDARRTTNQRLGSRLPMAGFGNTSIAPAVGGGLPPTRMDSFVFNSGGRAYQIYGDEGTNALPPYEEFTKDHRINEGIVADRDAGLTTGHGSYLPDAWGNDEFLGEEWSQSGANGGNRLTTYHQIPNPVRLPPKFNTHQYRNGRFVNIDREQQEQQRNMDRGEDHIHQ